MSFAKNSNLLGLSSVAFAAGASSLTCHMSMASVVLPDDDETGFEMVCDVALPASEPSAELVTPIGPTKRRAEDLNATTPTPKKLHFSASPLCCFSF